VVFPVPAYPLTNKAQRDLEVAANLPKTCKSRDCPSVGWKGKKDKARSSNILLKDSLITSNLTAKKGNTKGYRRFAKQISYAHVVHGLCTFYATFT
jgi:hypothetical protein